MNAPLPTAADHARWQAERIAALTRPDGWLTLVGLFWLEEGDHAVGSAGACEIHLPSGPERLGTLRLHEGAAEWRPLSGEAQILQSDAAGEPTIVRDGSLSFLVIERDGRLAVRVRDNEAEARRGFAGIASFPFDPAWCLDARWDGNRVHFEIAGQPCSLGPRKPTGETWQFVFADATSGGETYGGGRFLFMPALRGPTFHLDFNRAINPPCVFTPYATCPLPKPENRLGVAVTAGEKSV
ncbi:MAG: DUF1684 domain-containing protein [Sulfurisoma sp.]|nr:DUF1684 domain-containing protein [Sulfurisoma sp.]